jgi:hypothetical protein
VQPVEVHRAVEIDYDAVAAVLQERRISVNRSPSTWPAKAEAFRR